MITAFEVSNSHINNLNDKQLTKVLSDLLYLEANKFGIAESCVSCSLDITVSDGGEDASIKWDGEITNTDWLKCQYNLFQCKATDMSPSKCKEEILVRDKNGIKLKPMVEETFENGGCYILFYNKSLSPTMEKSRIDKFREGLKEADKAYWKEAKIYIYDANKIASWTNNYISVILEVLNYNGITIPQNFLTWDQWNGYDEFDKYHFETDNKLERYVNQLREHLSNNKQVARIVGLSGLGKTRLALEVFRSNTTYQSKILNKKVVYIDASYSQESLISQIVNFRSRKISSVLVVDNCSIDLHKALLREILHDSSRLSLLTLDYNPESINADYPIIELKPVSSGVIEKIIKQSYSNLSQEDIRRVVQFSQGFPQMAVLIAEARLNDEESIGTLKDSDIANKLLWGRDEKDSIKLETIRSCAIFENVGFFEDKYIERDFVAEHICSDIINKDNFYSSAQYFIRKGILDKRGRYIAVTPLPLAVRLAAEWWQNCRPERAKTVILSEMPNNMVEFLCNQISKLHFVQEARDLTKDLCGSNGPFGQAEVLNTERGSRIFRSLVEVNPYATSGAIYNSIKSYSIDELRKISEGRRNLVWALEKLCFWKDTFHTAATALLMLAAGENESWGNNATGILMQLFHVFLSGTQAEPDHRIKIIVEALSKDEKEYKEIAIKLLGNVIETQGFSRAVGAEEQGIRGLMKEWSPKDWSEVFDYWDSGLNILTNIGKRNNELGKLARDQISNNFRGLVQYGRMDVLNTCIVTIGENLNYFWPEILEAIKVSIRYEGPKIPEEGKIQLIQWRDLFQPKTFKEKLKLLVSMPEWDHGETDEDEYIDLSEIKAKEFAKQCIQNASELYENFGILFTGEQRKGFIFGFTFGSHYNKQEKFINNCIIELKNSVNPNATVLAGFLSSIKQTNYQLVSDTLDIFAEDDKLIKHLMYLTSVIRPDKHDIERALRIMERKKVPLIEYRYLARGWATEGVDVSGIRELSNSLLRFGVEGKLVALDIIWGYTYHKTNLVVDFRDIVVSIILDSEVINCMDEYSQMDSYHWEKSLERLLDLEEGIEYAIRLYKTLVFNITNNKYEIGLYKIYTTALFLIFRKYPKELWRFLCNDLLTEDSKIIWKLEEMISGIWLYQVNNISILELVDEEDIIEWLNNNKIRAAQIVVRVVRNYQTFEGRQRFHNIISYIINQFGYDRGILDSIVFHMGPSSWVGSLILQYETKVEILREYYNSSNHIVRMWARENIDNLNRQIEFEKVREEEQSNGIY